MRKSPKFGLKTLALAATFFSAGFLGNATELMAQEKDQVNNVISVDSESLRLLKLSVKNLKQSLEKYEKNLDKAKSLIQRKYPDLSRSSVKMFVTNGMNIDLVNHGEIAGIDINWSRETAVNNFKEGDARNETMKNIYKYLGGSFINSSDFVFINHTALGGGKLFDNVQTTKHLENGEKLLREFQEYQEEVKSMDYTGELRDEGYDILSENFKRLKEEIGRANKSLGIFIKSF